jgi:hypothetical protein
VSDRGKDVRIILKWTIQCEHTDWIHVAQDSGRRRLRGNTVMKIRISHTAWNFLISWVTISF